MTALHLSHSHQHASELNTDIARLRAILYHATCRKLVRQIGGADHGRRDATVVENRAASRDSNPDEAGAFLIYIKSSGAILPQLGSFAVFGLYLTANKAS